MMRRTLRSVRGSQGKHAPSLTVFVTKNISELDFIVPVLWRMRRSCPQARLRVVYCCCDKRQVLRRGQFYSRIFSEEGVEERDMLGPAVGRGLQWMVRPILRQSAWDVDGSEGSLLSARQNALRLSLERFVMRRVGVAVKDGGPAELGQGDILFWPHRAALNGPSRIVWEAVAGADRPVVHYPHGPYYSSGGFRPPLPPSGDPAVDGEIPADHDIWYPHLADDVAAAYPRDRAKFFFSGYPGLDAEWLEYVRRTALTTNVKRSVQALECLFIIRMFMDGSDDAWVFETEEFINLCKNVKDAIEKCGRRISVTVKPHPSNNHPRTRAVLDELGANDWHITYDPIYPAAARSDLVISVPSTSNLIPAISGLPVVLLNCSVKRAFDRWQGMRKLYPDDLQFYASAPEDVAGKLREAVQFIEGSPAGSEVPIRETRDLLHFRKEFPDGMLPRIEARIMQLHERGAAR